MIVKNKFKIDGMHCVSCAINIDFDVEDLAGVKESKTNYARQVTEVQYDPLLATASDICGVIEKLGYKSSLME